MPPLIGFMTESCLKYNRLLFFVFLPCPSAERLDENQAKLGREVTEYKNQIMLMSVSAAKGYQLTVASHLKKALGF